MLRRFCISERTPSQNSPAPILILPLPAGSAIASLALRLACGRWGEKNSQEFLHAGQVPVGCPAPDFAKNGAIDLCCGLHQYATDKRVDLDGLEARRLC
jgi:hypothetical protein